MPVTAALVGLNTADAVALTTAQAAVLACVVLDAAPTATAASLSVRDKADALRSDILGGPREIAPAHHTQEMP